MTKTVCRTPDQRKLVATLMLSGCLWAPVAIADQSPCSRTQFLLTHARDEETHKINTLLGQNLAMADNAKKCIDKVIKTADLIIAPKFPNLAKMSMDRILAYLANAACKVAIKQVEGVAKEINGSLYPITSQLRDFENQVNGAIGQVGWEGGMPNPDYNFNKPSGIPGVEGGGAGGAQPRPDPRPAPPRDPNCGLGFGANCR